MLHKSTITSALLVMTKLQSSKCGKCSIVNLFLEGDDFNGVTSTVSLATVSSAGRRQLLQLEGGDLLSSTGR